MIYLALCTTILETAGKIMSNTQNTLLSTNIKSSVFSSVRRRCIGL